MATCFGLLTITREGRLIIWVEVGIWCILAILIILKRHFWMLRSGSVPIFAASSPIVHVAVLVTSLGLVITPSLIVAAVNEHYYNVPISNSVEEGAFPKFYARLTGVRQTEISYIPRVPIRVEVMKAILSNAPEDEMLARILEPLSAPADSAQPGCQIYPETCVEYGGGWFMWKLRDVIAEGLGSRCRRTVISGCHWCS
jgi:hypothetical protein